MLLCLASSGWHAEPCVLLLRQPISLWCSLAVEGAMYCHMVVWHAAVRLLVL